MSVAEHVWYIEPGDAGMNEICARELPEDAFLRDVRCADGRFYNLWRCKSYSFVIFLERSRDKGNAQICFRTFRQRGRGHIELWPPGQKRRILKGIEAVDEREPEF